MLTTKKIIAVSGNTRKYSTQLNFINAIANLSKEIFTISIFDGLLEIPHFNPDIDDDHPPMQVVEFRKQLRDADGILICTPEYAMGVPGTLKNAIDWTVSSCEFNHKPTALITASSLGHKGHASLLETLRIIEANVTDETQLVISFAKIKVNKEYVITDEKTLTDVMNLIKAFHTILTDTNNIANGQKD